ncbi:hypothetical protein AAG570_002057, partial [Ranatra chinensis]
FFWFQASGVTVSDACKTTYEEIKKDKKHRYVVFYIRDEKQIDVEVIGDRNAQYENFLADLQKGGTGECRYGLYDFEYSHQCQGTSEASKKQKLFLMSWCPDTAKVKKKMLYSSSFDALKKSLVGVQKYIQVLFYFKRLIMDIFLWIFKKITVILFYYVPLLKSELLINCDMDCQRNFFKSV